MTIEELNKLIKEELNAFLEAEDDDVDAGDDIEVTTDEPAVEDGDEALDTLRQIFNMLKPLVEPEEEEMDMDGEETEDEEIADGEGDEESLDEVDLAGVYNPAAIDATNNALTDVTGIPLNILVPLIVFGFPLAIMYGGDAVNAVSQATKRLPRFVRRAVQKAFEIVQKSGKSGEKVAQQVKNAQEKQQAALATQMKRDNDLDLSEVSDAQKVKFIKEYLTSLKEAVDNHTFFRGDNANRVRPEAKDVQGRREKVNESVEKITEETSNDLTARFQKLANIQK